VDYPQPGAAGSDRHAQSGRQEALLDHLLQTLIDLLASRGKEWLT